MTSADRHRARSADDERGEGQDTCDGALFEQHRWKLQTTGMTFMNLDWANRDAACFVCVACRRIHWFHL
ncbi:hypothetical protein [Microtetraspora malaysiensis]|uniref:hypothetical protein n=1 Tax=Microtetraspora malaysiensis TaxID=161358 RepID=UPI0008310FB6|nr:hypothetical protein [Microtetraspora malaysiensis]